MKTISDDTVIWNCSVSGDSVGMMSMMGFEKMEGDSLYITSIHELINLMAEFA